jgi:transcription antitermination factor NusG
MFPNYLFILVTGQWRPALSIPSVSNAIKFGSAAAPSAVPDAVIEEIRKREAEEAHNPEPPKLKAGAIVSIKDGPLDDRLGCA